jgi:hypothetical protein
MSSENTLLPPDNLWDVDAQLEFNEALPSDDQRYVPTAPARGNFSFTRLLKALGVDDREQQQWILRKAHPRGYHLFCGHRGCGKSTELRRLAARLHNPQAFFVVFMDVLEQLDYNNLQYADVLLALAKELFEKLEAENLDIDEVLLDNLQTWFAERVETNEKTKDFAAEVRAGASVESGIPFLGKLFADISTAIKNNSSYKEELRTIVENSFSQFAASFNLCIKAAEDAVQKSDKGKKLLFIVDGTDRLRGKDSERFFVGDVHQLKQIDANFIYCAPISLLYEGYQVQHEFNHFILPMIKLREKHDPAPLSEAYTILEQLIYKRAAPSLFTSPSLVDRLIEFSGGTPRELLKLLHYAFLRASGEQFDEAAVEAAIQDLATDYKRILEPQDYELLRQVDQSTQDSEENSERVRHCLYHLMLLEYNGFWRLSHPVIRTLPGYTGT